MPCGGIYPGAPGVAVKDLKPIFTCWVCNLRGAMHFCDEWDTFIHARCVPDFLQTEEGQILIHHKHAVILDFELEEPDDAEYLRLKQMRMDATREDGEQQLSTQGESEMKPIPPFDHEFDNDPED